jgi:hypothetical protein
MEKEAFIEGKKYDVPEQEQIPERTKVTIEMAHRILDLHEMDPGAAITLLRLMVKIYSIDPWVYHLTLAILAGHKDAEKSLADKAAEEHVSKQHIHQRQNRALSLLAKRFPLVAQAIREILGRKKSLAEENLEEKAATSFPWGTNNKAQVTNSPHLNPHQGRKDHPRPSKGGPKGQNV